MNSPCDARGPDAVRGFPVRLLHTEPRKKEVSRLEFYAAGEQHTEATESGDLPKEPGEAVKEEAAAREASEQSQAEESSAQIEAARREARLAARAEWEEEWAERLAAERAAILKTSAEFVKERARYFAGVETEVVKLALAIAARVLHREAQFDPLLLSATVRVALERAAEDSGIVLRVPVEDVETWRGIFEKEGDTAVTLLGDERLSIGECVLDTNVGKVELGVSAQLSEIEKGFFDLLQQRPA